MQNKEKLIEQIRKITDFPSLIAFLQNELDWRLTADDIEDLFFDYDPEELGIDPNLAVKIKEIKQLRPFTAHQPWGIFYISFEPKRLPVMVMRRILQALVIKKRQTARHPKAASWHLHDLLFISSYGEQDRRAITFAHFCEEAQGDLPTLKVIGWDAQDTPLHIDRCIQELSHLRFDPELTPDQWRQKWASAFTLKYREVISNSKVLSRKLAETAMRIRIRVNQVLQVESLKGPMQKLFKACRDTLINDLTEDRFADMFAQTIAYGLFSARCSRKSGALVAENLRDMIPETNLFLRELLSTFFTIGRRKGKIDFDELGINDVVQMLRNTDMDAVLRDFGDKNRAEDPVIHFYEDFLKQYDVHQKIKRGAFYTPRPVVSFIVRSVHELLQEEFGLEDGLADTKTWGELVALRPEVKIPKGVSSDAPFVQILDPATGTGTFLVEVIDLIFQTMKAKWKTEGKSPSEIRKQWNEYVPKHLLPRIYGFELMMAPYTIAHMKIALKLVETGYLFKPHDVIRIYLTNSLEPAKDTLPGYLESFSPALAHEAKGANHVKKSVPITVVIGNPPYSVSSSNKNIWIESLIADYKRNLNERNIQPLSDDYIKFIRFGQYMMDKNGYGILSYISNNSFIDGIIHRQMRKHLSECFHKVYILDLHGNAKKKETAPDGGKDENVFDIMQGVSINIFVKRSKQGKSTQMFHFDLFGKREDKCYFLNNNMIESIGWNEFEVREPSFFFVEKDLTNVFQYEKYIHLKELFLRSSMGIATGNDNDYVAFDNIMIEEKFKLKSSKFNYRPFDIRYTIFDNKILQRARYDLSKLLLIESNYSLNIAYFSKNSFPQQLITKSIICRHLISGETYFFPLYLYLETDSLTFSKTPPRQPNLNMSIIKQIAEKIGLHFTPEKEPAENTFAPIDILDYIYAVLHSPSYREKYKEFLKIDFPRVPYPHDAELFWQLVKLGGELRRIHLLEHPKVNEFITAYPESGTHIVEKVRYDGKRVWINSRQYFDHVPQIAWEFYIGGYQPAQKWLKDRKGRTLSDEDIEHYQKIIVALTETDRLMKEIDKVYDVESIV